ncbi:MAG: LUD domain-containing protein [Melioribacteraceae bacterium]
MTNTQEMKNLVEQFKTVAISVDTTVDIIERTPHSLNIALQKTISKNDSVVLSEIEHLDVELFEIFKNESKNIIINPTNKQLANAKVGITDAFAAVASTGSVCVTITNSMAGTFSLFTTKHIAIVDSKNIVQRPREVFQLEPFKTITSKQDFLFISGSSATADMGPLVRGVHGPAKLHVIIIA